MSERIRVVSGIQPSGDLTIGNWLGAIRRWVAAQDEWDGYYFVVDLHALTVPQDPAALREKTLQVAATYVACGIDPARSRVFLQSHVPAHSELAWLLDCFLPMGWLDRMTQFKVKTGGERERASAGLYTYPALMAADILLYDTTLVPVGDDQRQHVEIARDVAKRVNGRLGPIFTLPEVLLGASGARIMGLDDPRVKMSKSTARTAGGHAIAILDPPDVIRRKVAQAVTDGGRAVTEPLGDGVANLVDILAAVTARPRVAVMAELTGVSYARLKDEVAGALVAGLEPIQARYRQLRADDGELRTILRNGAEAASTIAERTLRRLQDAVGLVGR